jgi:hypothetical protein
MKSIALSCIFSCVAIAVFAQKDYATGLIWDKTAYSQMPTQKRSRSLEVLPRSISLKAC